MRLNKRECRKFADPGLKINSDNGLFHANQINFIVRTSTKIIDHHKTLILYIYSRELAAHGDVRPCMTLFHCQDDFITLARNEDGSTKWRTVAFDDLGTKWHFTSECAFYSVKDGMSVSSYFKNSAGNGFKPLVEEQFKIQEKRRLERQRLKESRIVSRMSCVGALPRGLKHWIHRSIMPAYFFYDYKKGGNDVLGVCSSCGKEVQFSGVKQGVKKICTHCRKELTCKPRSRRGSYMYDRDTVQVIQGTGDGGLVIRIVKVYYSYAGDIPDVQIYENARQFIYQDSDGKVRTESYYHSYGGILTSWKKGTRPVFYAYQYNFSADTCGHLYTKNLSDALTGTPWQYCQIDRFYKHFHDSMQALPFLTEYMKHPQVVEHLTKTGFHFIVFDLVNGHNKNCLNETQHRTHRILGIAAEDVDFLRGLDIGLSVLKIFQGYRGMKGRQELLMWQLKNQVSHDIPQLLCHMTPHKLMRYMDNQYSFLRFRKTPYGSLRYSSLQDLVSEYRDYLEMCEKLNYDLKNSFVLYPKDLQKAHDKEVKHQKQKADAKLKRDFIAAYKKITGKFDFEYNGMKIIQPATPSAVIKEGHELHHCVGGFVDRAARQEAVILFLRQCSELSKPFYTIEIRDWKIIQVRGMKNCDATPEVQEFISAWEKRVLSRLDTAA